MRVFLKLGLGAMIALPPSCDAVPWRALQVVLACPCEYCVGKGNTVADCESFGSDCSCYRGCPCATCVGKGNTVADCESFGGDCSCYRDPGPSACADFGGRTATVNAVCCNEKTEDCSSGRPATCNLGCAHVLLPFFDDCAGALGPAGAALFDDVVALCRTAEPPEFIYALGGRAAGSNNLNTVEQYDPGTNTWSAVAPMSTVRSYLAAAVLGGHLYALGGIGNTRLNTVERYDPGLNTWTAVAPMSTARYYLAAAVLGGHLYALGGSDGNTNLNTVERFDPGLNTWTAVAPMSAARSYLAASVLGGHLYALGGYDRGTPLLTVERYDPGLNTWTAVAPMSTARFALAAAACC